MKLPSDMVNAVTEFAGVHFDAPRRGLRTNWQQGSYMIMAIHTNPWWCDYISTRSSARPSADFRCDTWVDWCCEKMIIGPPRYRSEREIAIAGMDEDYLSDEELQRHLIPWMHTWPRYDDYVECCRKRAEGIPEWAKREYCTAAV